MSETTGCTAEWHLETSRPDRFLDYMNPETTFSCQINTLLCRFRDVQALCEHEQTTSQLCRLRDELAFHLVKMSRWWAFDFCPRALTEIRNPLFLSYVKAHVERSIDDESLFDLFTMQRHMHAGDSGHILVMGANRNIAQGITLHYGVDGKQGFRFATSSQQAEPTWNGKSYTDFAGAWLAARTVHALICNDDNALRESEMAQREHDWARPWHQRHFHRCCDRHGIQAYKDACSRLTMCQSTFGRQEFETIVNRLAFMIARAAFQRQLTIAEMLINQDQHEMTLRAANTIKRRARRYVALCMDPCIRPEQDTMLDRVISYIPRQCG